MNTILITCKTDTSIDIKDIKKFQGNLKEKDDESISKLIESIKKYGFSFPVFIWENKLLDGHQRIEAIERLIEDGYTLPGNKLPAINIKAENETEAAEKLLLINNRYAKITQYGFDEFISEYNINLDSFFEFIEIPEVEFENIEPIEIGENSDNNTDDENDIIVKLIFSSSTWSTKADSIMESIENSLKKIKVRFKTNINE